MPSLPSLARLISDGPSGQLSPNITFKYLEYHDCPISVTASFWVSNGVPEGSNNKMFEHRFVVIRSR